MALGGGRLRAGLLAEHVVGQLAAPVLLDPAHAHRGELDQRVARELPHARLGHVEHLGELVVGLPLAEHELDDRPLLRRKLVERGHSGANCSVPGSVDSPVETYPAPGTLDDVLGFELLEATDTRASAHNSRPSGGFSSRFGLVHGGAYVALAESMVSIATIRAVMQRAATSPSGQSNDTSFLRPVTEGHVHAEGVAHPSRPHLVGVGRALHGRPGSPLRRVTRDDRGQAGAEGLKSSSTR